MAASDYRFLVITKHLLDPMDARAQQSFALVRALLSANVRLDVITGDVGERASVPSSKNLGLHALPAAWHSRKQNIGSKITRKIERNVFAVKPSQWSRRACDRASELMAGNTYDALISLAMPMESHLAALHARRSAPWIASMSDPWPESILPPPYSDFSIPLLDRMQKQVVARVFGTADRLVFTCAEQRDFLIGHYPQVTSRKSVVIPHIAPPLHQPGSRADAPALPTIVHAGALSRERVCTGLVDAIGDLPESSSLQFRFVGHVHREMQRALERPRVAARVRLDGWKPKAEALRIMLGSTALLLLEARMRVYPFLPSKVADYSSTGRPILAITGQSSPTARLLRQYNAGWVSDHSADSIRAALAELEAGTDDPSSLGLWNAFSAERAVAAYKETAAALPCTRTGS